MKSVHRCLLCLGSNHEGEKHLRRAETLLNERFGKVMWGRIIETVPEGTGDPRPYLNRAAALDTMMEKEELKELFKETERACGRTDETRRTGTVPLDIDLLMFDAEVLKPADLSRKYVQEALENL